MPRIFLVSFVPSPYLVRARPTTVEQRLRLRKGIEDMTVATAKLTEREIEHVRMEQRMKQREPFQLHFPPKLPRSNSKKDLMLERCPYEETERQLIRERFGR